MTFKKNIFVYIKICLKLSIHVGTVCVSWFKVKWKKKLKPIQIFHLKKNEIDFNNATLSKEYVYSCFNNII